MKLAAKITFYLGLISVLIGAGFLSYGLLTNNRATLLIGVYSFVMSIILEGVALRLSIAIDRKENPVESKDEARKPH